MSKVFIPQRPARFDKERKEWVPTMDLTAASEFGELCELLPPSGGWLTPVQVYDKLIKGLHDHKFSFDDFFIMVGSPVVTATLLPMIAKQISPMPIRLLVWDRLAVRYIEQKVRTV